MNPAPPVTRNNVPSGKATSPYPIQFLLVVCKKTCLDINISLPTATLRLPRMMQLGTDDKKTQANGGEDM